MSGIDIFAWIVLFVILGSALVVFVVLGTMPGKVAVKRNHPQADAINVASWLSLIVGGVAWPLVMTWAYLNPVSDDIRKSKSSLENQHEPVSN